MRWCSPNNIGLGITMKASVRSSTNRGEGACDLVGTISRRKWPLHSQGPRRILDTLHDVRHRMFAVCMRMPECSHANEPGNDISEQLQALGDQFRAEKSRPGDITARPPQACDQFVAHRV